MPNQASVLPIYGPGSALLGYVSLDAAQRMLDHGQAVPLGTKRRVRALAATRDNYELLAGDKLPTNCKYSHKRETPLNPKGVWAFRKLAKP